MRVAGIIAEYNPLHNGHAYHIEETRSATSCDFLIAIMSGSFVQRGEPAAFDKWARASWALEAGVDLVLELPAVFALSSADRFARGGIRILCALGVLTHLCFGSEVENAANLYESASLIDRHSDKFRSELRRGLSQGMSFPRAQFAALKALGMPEPMLEVLIQPNGMLGVEYVRALRLFDPNVTPVPIPRIGPGHDNADFCGEFSSASAIRQELKERGGPAIQSSVPPYVYMDIIAQLSSGRAPVSLGNISLPALYALRSLPLERLKALPDVNEGLENALYKAAREASTLDELLLSVKSKRYTLARLKRICMSALLGFTLKDVEDALNPNYPLYARVLGMRERAWPLLRAIKRNGKLPLVARKADMDKLGEKERHILGFDLFASDTHALGMPGNRASAGDYSNKLIMLKD